METVEIVVPHAMETSRAPAEAPTEPSSQEQQLLEACADGDEGAVLALLGDGVDPAQYDDETGASCLMLAAAHGAQAACKGLLQAGAPWNALDRRGKCAGEYALDAGHQAIVNMIVDHAVRCEMLLGAAGRNERLRPSVPPPASSVEDDALAAAPAPASESESYLSRAVRYDGDRLLDEADDAVMMAWESPLMLAHAKLLCGVSKDRRVLNIGFGMGIIDGFIQEQGCSRHTIIEAHPEVAARAARDGWAECATLVEGRWQDVLAPGGAARACAPFDAIFYDAYAEDYSDMRELHAMLPELLAPGGSYSFFNGLCPDNLFFHGVICQLVQVRRGREGRVPSASAWGSAPCAPERLWLGRLSPTAHASACASDRRSHATALPPRAREHATLHLHASLTRGARGLAPCAQLELGGLGLSCEFVPVPIEVAEEEWQGVARKYWHNRDTYYLPVALLQQAESAPAEEGMVAESALAGAVSSNS
jgi:protein arginine N-methyltransferase 2